MTVTKVQVYTYCYRVVKIKHVYQFLGSQPINTHPYTDLQPIALYYRPVCERCERFPQSPDNSSPNLSTCLLICFSCLLVFLTEVWIHTVSLEAPQTTGRVRTLTSNLN